MRQRLNARAVDTEVWVEQVGQPDALRLGGDAERLAITIEVEGAAGLNQLEARLGIAIEQPSAGPSLPR
jgi:hypothetical protein